MTATATQLDELTIDEVARRMDRHYDTVRAWVRDNRVRHYRIARTIRIFWPLHDACGQPIGPGHSLACSCGT